MLLNRKTMAVVLMAVTACLSLAAAADDNDAFRQSAEYMKYVGTYYTDNGQMVTLHSDGTQTTVVARMFSDNPTVIFGRKTTIAQGVWRYIGKNEIKITNIRFWSEAFGHNYDPNGLIFKATFVAVFDQPVRGSSPGFTVGDVLVETFQANQNPVTDEPSGSGMLTTSGYRGYRLEVNETAF